MRNRPNLIIAALASVGLSTPLWSQSIDTSFLGTTRDSSGALLPGATVTITSSAEGLTRSVTTGSDGSYAIRYLKPGTYDFTVISKGFATTSKHAGC